MKLKIKMVSLCAVMIMALGLMTTSVSASSSYILHYTQGADSTTNVTSVSATAPSTGASRITVKSTYFSTLISGAYCQVYGVNYNTTTAHVNSTGTYYLDYNGSTIPKKNVNVTVYTALVDYYNSASVAANGQVTR